MNKLLKASTGLLLAVAAAAPVVQVKANNSVILINEVEADDPSGGNDWVEIINTGSETVDISGWFVTDEKGLERFNDGETTPFADGTVLEPGAVMVLEEGVNFTCGLGKGGDAVILFDSTQNEKDRFTWSDNADGTWSRMEDGTFVDAPATKGIANSTVEPVIDVVINEVESNGDATDWVEIKNNGSTAVDISGWCVTDDKGLERLTDGETTPLADQTSLSPGAYYVFEGDKDFKFGLGAEDTVTLYQKDDTVVAEYSWNGHASGTYARIPDGTGELVDVPISSKATENKEAVPAEGKLVLNEINSNPDDWVEVINTGDSAVDLSGWYVLDNDPVGHAAETTPLPDGTILEPGALYVFEENKDFAFGLGKEDKVTVYAPGGAVVAEYSWNAHAAGVYARIPDGTGEFVDTASSTKGRLNIVMTPVVINEVQSNDPSDGPDWIELANPTGEILDVSGIVIKDSDDDHAYTIPEGTTIAANGFLVIEEGENGFDFGLGKGDSVRLFEDGNLIASTTWTDHTNPTWGLYPDVNGTEYRNTLEATPGAANRFAGVPETTQWDGSNEVVTVDTKSTFLEDSSGLDFHNGQLYAVDNGTATFWIMDVNEDGSVVLPAVSSYRVRYAKDDANAAGPDAEGITVDGEGNVYIASERDNSDKGVNYNSILMAEIPSGSSTGDIAASKDWKLNDLLPSVSANMGIEAVEWVENANVEGRLIDKNTNAAYDSSRYANAIGDGLFFVALEDNGHVYAFVLNEDETAVLVADIDSKLGGAMALDYDTYENVLYVAADNGYGNKIAKVSFNGTNELLVTHILPPDGLDTNANYEGFALADVTYAKNGLRPVYRFQDGVTSGALSELWMTHNHNYSASEYQYDETGHWHVCDCGEKGSVEAHTFGEWTKVSDTAKATTVTQVRTCSICGYAETRTVTVPADHTEHTYGTAYASDETGHWHVCTVCGEKRSVEAHTFGEWKKVDNGSEERVCDVCGYKETRKVTEPSPSVSTGNYIDPLPWVIILVGCSLVLAGSTMYRRKKEKEENNG